jgi:peptidyl-prolyl cis-trans isomerase-like 1
VCVCVCGWIDSHEKGLTDYRSFSTNTLTLCLFYYYSYATQGTFCIELYHKHSPRSCYNIAALAHAGYYNGTIFHRVIRDFMIQGGDPTGTGRGGESIYTGKFQDEISRNLKHTGAGVVSMANSGPNTNGSQFFITVKPTPWLDGKHTVFGRIYSGMDVIQRMSMVATDADNRPSHAISIHKATPFRGPPPPKQEQEQMDSSSSTQQAHEQITAS